MKTLTRRGRLFGKDFRTFSKRISEKCSKHTISFGEWPLVSIFLFVWREIFAVTTTTNQITVWPYLSQIEQMYKTSKMEGRGGMVIFFQILHQLFLWDLCVVRYWVLKGRQIFEKKKDFWVAPNQYQNRNNFGDQPWNLRNTSAVMAKIFLHLRNVF